MSITTASLDSRQARQPINQLDSRFYSVVVGAPPPPKEIEEIKDLDDDGESSSEEEAPVLKKSAFGEKEKAPVPKVVGNVTAYSNEVDISGALMPTKQESKSPIRKAAATKLAAHRQKTKNESISPKEESAAVAKLESRVDEEKKAQKEDLDAPEEALKDSQKVGISTEEATKGAAIPDSTSANPNTAPDNAENSTEGISPLIVQGSSSSSLDTGLGLNVKATLITNPDLFSCVCPSC